MNKHFIKMFILTLSLIKSITCHGQDHFNGLGESAIALKYSNSKSYQAQFSLRSRYFLYQNNEVSYKQQQFDAFHYSTLQLNNKNRLGLGIYYRQRDFLEMGSNEFRLAQQYIHKSKISRFQLGHRLRTEQRFLDTKTIFRQRYRLKFDFPIIGSTLENGEPYFIAALEGLLSLSESQPAEIDQRATAQLGIQFNKSLKIRAGLEYRLEAINVLNNTYLFLLSSAVINI
ncbi:DUF2490 domain-containing protein [Gaetbulibacter saemankumensis]|uniref:DUF2490 domain-containing protein n=1 Tax=Gaetbulibacter saemankumensis TaxID=311208 RepID=UPI00040C0B10|nr:DUF2490 domain-containing protein [Gaetbulibacter saemankumensis]